MKKFFLFVFVVFIFSFSLSANKLFIKSLYSGRNCIKSTILALIHYEKKSIIAAVYSLFDRDIIKELAKASDHGVEVKVITDGFSKDKRSPLKPLIKRNVLQIYRSGGRGLMHNKFWVFGDDLIATGSFNGTLVASKQHRENILLAESASVAEDLKTYFRDLSLEIDIQEKNSQLQELNFERAIKEMGLEKNERWY